MNAISIKCPNCGDSLSTEMKICPSCKQPVVITKVSEISSFTPLQLNKYVSSYKKIIEQNQDNVEVNASIGACFLRLKQYDKALISYENAIENNFQNSEYYFYAGISVLNGKKPFLCQRGTIDKALEYINSAIMIEPKGIYFYILSYIKFDYFERKFFKTTPNYIDAFEQAKVLGVSKEEITEIFSLMSVSVPAEIEF